MVNQVCAKCYRVKELTPAHSDLIHILVCTRCRWDIEETMGFLFHNGVEVTLSLPPENPEDEEKTPESN